MLQRTRNHKQKPIKFDNRIANMKTKLNIINDKINNQACKLNERRGRKRKLLFPYPLNIGKRADFKEEGS